MYSVHLKHLYVCITISNAELYYDVIYFFVASHCYCSTCGFKNENRDLQKRVRMEKKQEMELKWKMAKKVNMEIRKHGLTVIVKDGGAVTVEKFN